MSAQERIDGRLEAAAWLQAHAESEATGSRDFGRGYGHAIHMLRSSATWDAPSTRTVECSVCHRDVVILNSGKLAGHSYPDDDAGVCAGSGMSWRASLVSLTDGGG